MVAPSGDIYAEVKNYYCSGGRSGGPAQRYLRRGQKPVIFQEGGVVAPPGDIYAEAKNWAGELISGQTRAGKILVSIPFRSTKLCNYSSRFMLIFDIKMCIKCV